MAAITPDELDRRLDNGGDEPLVLDIRHFEDFADWHIEGSEHVDVYDELQADPAAATEDLGDLPRDREIVTVCAAGVVSETATETLEEMNYEARTLVDGMGGWARLHRSATLEANLEGTLIQVARPGTGCLSYVLISDGEAAVFEASQYLSEYEAILAQHDADLVGVFDTHAHADHLSGGPRLADRYDVPYYLHPDDAYELDATHVEQGDVVSVGDLDLEVSHTPGHSPGGVSFAIEGEALLTGDTLFHESVGRVELGIEADFEDTNVEDNAATLYDSLERLREQPGNPLVLPSHDPGSPDPPLAFRMDAVEARNDGLKRDRDEFIAAFAEVPDQPSNFERIKRVNTGAEIVAEDERESLEQGPNNCAAE